MKKTEEQIGIRKRTAKMYIEENKELKKENKELRKENERLQNFVDDLLDKMNNIKIVYIEFEKAETEYDKKLAVLDKLIMNR